MKSKTKTTKESAPKSPNKPQSNLRTLDFENTASKLKGIKEELLSSHSSLIFLLD